MAYIKTVWVDDSAPYLSATPLNNIENGIESLDLNKVGTWDNTVAYTTGQAVYYSGKFYKALQNGTNKQPSSEAAYWEEIGATVDTSDFVLTSSKGQANGVASLDGDGLIPASQIGAIDLTSVATKTEVRNGDLENSAELSKALFDIQTTLSSGLIPLSNMAVDAFNADTGVDLTASLNEYYDSGNDWFTPNVTTRAAKTVTANGNAKISTTQSKFGGASGYFDGTGDYLSLADSEDFNFGSGDFTIRGWVRFNALAGAGLGVGVFSQGGLEATNNSVRLVLYGSGLGGVSGKLQFVAWIDDNNTQVTVTSTTSPTTNQWYHVEITRSSTNLRLFIDGNLEATANISTNAVNNSSKTFDISRSTNGSDYTNCYMDDFEIAKGIARHTAGFTPSTSAIVPDEHSVLYLPMDGSNNSTTFSDDNSLPTGDLTLISNALTCSSVPAYGYVITDTYLPSGGTVTYYLSRDNGTTWTEATPNTLVDISAQPSGTSLRIKAVTSGGSGADYHKIKAWAWGWK